MLLASCSYEDAKKYRNKLVLVGSEETKKAEEVLLNIVTDNPDEVLEKGLGGAKCLTSSVNPKSCPKNLWGNVFHLVPYEEFDGVSEVEGVVCLVELPEGFCDMQKIVDISLCNEGYSDVEHKVRFIGGNLLEIPGVGIGRYDKGKEKMSAVFNGIYDIFREVKLEDIEVREIMSKVRAVTKKSTNSGSKTKSVVSNSKSKKKDSFAKLFGGSNGGF